jgi:hypothetical protein
MLRNIHNEDFENLFNVRNYIFKAIESFRRYKSRGVIAQFDPERFDEYLLFSRIGNGSIGGKARGLAFISMLIKKYQLHNKYKDTAVSIPRTVVLSTEIFEEFMEKNSLYNIALSSVDDQTILDHFIEAHMPQTISNDLYTLLRSMNKPIAVRSSSKLEDSLFQPFAGVYSTYMIPVNHNNIPHSVGQLEHAIKCVYASAFFKTSKSYIEATANVIDEEKMGIIIQEICGSEHDGIYYPTFSGVAHSINFYPIEPEKAEEGIASIAYGLGKYIVEGGLSLRFSPVHPQRSIQLSSTESALKNTQKHFFGLSLSPDSFSPSVSDDINLRKFRLRKLPADKSLKYVLSTYDLENQILRDGITSNGSRVITFANILKNKAFPIPEILNDLLRIGQTEMNNPIEIEFAVEIHEDQEHPCTFNLLQIRPVVKNTHVKVPDLHSITHNEMIISSDKALGNIHDKTITDIIYVKPESFEPAHSKEIAYRIAELNEIFVDENRYYILIGPGRWGSADPWLGIPVKWTQISHARLIIESGLKNYDIDPSQGTHFFHNLTSFGVGYFTLNPFKNKGFYNIKYLNDKLSLIEDNYIRHVRLNNPVEIMIDGKHGRGVVLKPFEER